MRNLSSSSSFFSMSRKSCLAVATCWDKSSCKEASSVWRESSCFWCSSSMIPKVFSSSTRNLSSSSSFFSMSLRSCLAVATCWAKPSCKEASSVWMESNCCWCFGFSSSMSPKVVFSSSTRNAVSSILVSWFNLKSRRKNNCFGMESHACVTRRCSAQDCLGGMSLVGTTNATFEQVCSLCCVASTICPPCLSIGSSSSLLILSCTHTNPCSAFVSSHLNATPGNILRTLPTTKTTFTITANVKTSSIDW
mmetsp:Transcript_25267/g.54997  ORF Transcript_25267/g.54997 Transcript_25267/m.54997 type:complete len:250 (+) Transcript_25267:1549-2298(+)